MRTLDSIFIGVIISLLVIAFFNGYRISKIESYSLNFTDGKTTQKWFPGKGLVE